MVSGVSWCSVLSAESQMLVRGHLNKHSPSETSLLQETGGQKGRNGLERGSLLPFRSEWCKDTYSSWRGFLFILFYFATRYPETQRPHPSLSMCLIWTSYPSQPKHRTCLHIPFIKCLWTVNKHTRNCSWTIHRRSCKQSRDLCGNTQQSSICREKSCLYC